MPSLKTSNALAKALGITEIEMLKQVGYLSGVPPSDEGLIDDPELRLFFRDEWKNLSQGEKELSLTHW